MTLPRRVACAAWDSVLTAAPRVTAQQTIQAANHPIDWSREDSVYGHSIINTLKVLHARSDASQLARCSEGVAVWDLARASCGTRVLRG